jgi:hypothetical protein
MAPRIVTAAPRQATLVVGVVEVAAPPRRGLPPPRAIVISRVAPHIGGGAATMTRGAVVIILSHFWDDMAMVNYKSEKINAYNGVKVRLRQEQGVKTG